MSRFIIKDSEGQTLTFFEEYNQAYGFIILADRVGQWTIVDRDSGFKASTKKQIAAIHFCEEVFNQKFEGDINNFYEVSKYLSENLDIAKDIMQDAIAGYPF